MMLSRDPGQAAVLFVVCTWLFADVGHAHGCVCRGHGVN